MRFGWGWNLGLDWDWAWAWAWAGDLPGWGDLDSPPFFKLRKWASIHYYFTIWF